MDFLEYSDISADIKGTQTKGRLKMTDQNIVFKNNKTGKVEQINATEMDFVNFQRMLDTYGIRIFMKNGSLHRFSGFKEGDQQKIAAYFKQNYKQEMLEKELSYRGWNWGTATFNGSLLSFNVENKTSFEIPLDVVSQCTPGKNEVTMEFHQNDEGPVSLMEMRFHIPTTETAETDPVDAFYQNVMNKASVISVSGDAIAIFREIHCLTPRGRYDIKIFSTFFQLHGKTFDYKIPMSTVLRLFLLPHKDNRQMFFVLSLDPPIKQGQTRYHYLVILFNMEDETSVELPFSEEDLRVKYENKLTKELSGPVYEVLGKIMKVLINRKLTGPGSFIGHSGTPAISCSFKAAAGYLYPLERGFIYVHKPPIHIRFEEISTVNFARSGGSNRSFDFEVELRAGTVYTFSSIEKEEYNKMFDFITSKKLPVKNTGKGGAKGGYSMDDFGDSDNENEPDAYLARVKAEAKEREDDDDEDQNSDESTDEDFKPNEQESDVAEEFDSNASSSGDSDEDSEGGGGGDSDGEKGKKKKSHKDKEKGHKEKEAKKKEKEAKKSSSSSKEKSSSKGGKAKKDDNKPKRPSTAFMIYMSENREKIKADNPGISFTDIAKKAGEIWKEMTDKSEWEAKAAKDKERYNEAMKNYKPPSDDEEDGGGGASASKGKKRKKESAPSPKKSSATSMAGGQFKSKEYISDDDSSGSDGSGDDEKKKSNKKSKSSSKKETAAAPSKKSKKESPKKSKSKGKTSEDDDEDAEDEEEEMTTTEESGSDEEDSD